MPSEIASRAIKFARYKSLSISDVERMCGLGNGTISSLSERTRKSTYDRISKAFPDLNIEWLRENKGEMIIADNPDVIATEVEQDYVPLLPVEAMAGALQFLAKGVALQDCRKIKCPVKGADWAIQISGDSMEPDYKNGSYIYIKKISGSFIPWGHTIVVDTHDGVVVKDIYPIDGNEDCIEARSINPKYPPFKIDKSIILGIYRVLGGSFINSTI